MEKLSGNLQHASFGIPGGAGMLSPIHVALQGTIHWLRITPELTQCLQDWGGNYKAHGKTHHSVPTAGEQVTTLHRVLR